MTFLSPLALFALSAAVIPPLLHLFQRREPPVVEFPAVRYLQQTQRESQRTVRLQHLLLMLLRVGAVVLIALAAARPVVPGGGGARHEPMALVLVLDNSLSSGAVSRGTRVLDDLEARARETLREAQAADALWLIGADDVARRGTAQRLIRAVSAARPEARRLDLVTAVRQAARLIATSGYARGEIHVLSDCQLTALDPAPGADTLLRNLPVVIYHPAGDPPANRGVSAAEPQPSLWVPGAGTVRAAVTGGPAGATVSLVVDGRAGARALASSGGEVDLAAPRLAPGWHTGTVQLEPDELRADDERPFAVRVAPPAAVAASGDLGAFVQQALGALAAAGRITEAQTGRRADVQIASEAGAGPIVILPPADPAVLGALNRRIASLEVPWRFGPPVARQDSIAVVGPAAPELIGARVLIKRPLEPLGAAPPGDVLATAGGVPWLVRHGQVVLVGSRLVPEETTLPLTGAFVPFVGALANRIARGESGVISAAPGDPILLPAGVTAIASRDTLVPATGGQALAAPAAPGVYALRAGRDTTAMLVVAPDPRESDLIRAGAAALRAAFPLARLSITDAPRDYGAARFRGAGRSELTGALLALALLLLLLEGLMAAGVRTRGATSLASSTS